jgi:hypothetical protein
MRSGFTLGLVLGRSLSRGLSRALGRSLGGILGLTLMVVTSVAVPLRAEDAPAANPAPAETPVPATTPTTPGCDVPDSLLETESSLPKVKEAAKAGNPVEVLVVGSRSSTIGADGNSAYPARMQEALKRKLPQLAVNISVEIRPKMAANEVSGELAKLVEAKKPTLVIWQTGTVDAMRAVDPDDFRTAVDDGVVALQNAGVDVILMNPQYSPRTETMISVPPYVDSMRAVAQQHDVPLFDRFAIMHQWNDEGDFDLFSAHHGLELAKRVHDCLGRALSTFMIGAAHLGPAQQN